MNRRDFAGLAALFMAGGFSRGSYAASSGSSVRPDVAVHDMSHFDPRYNGAEKVVMLGYQGMTALDLVGPQYMFASLWGAEVKVVAKTMDPIMTDTQLLILPDQTFDDAAKDLDILFVPGAVSGVLDTMEDEETLDFLVDRGARAKWITAVCTGSLILGQAGLLDGYRATSHWLGLDLLEEFGAIPVAERVVTDRNRITGGGVTAGIDMGLLILSKLRDVPYAQMVQLLAEYAPQPPFQAGLLETAPKPVRQAMVDMFPGFDAHVLALATQRRR
ncbi:MAG: DJ-1/PfpI family protein [Pseudomonadota bacterium]